MNDESDFDEWDGHKLSEEEKRYIHIIECVNNSWWLYLHIVHFHYRERKIHREEVMKQWEHELQLWVYLYICLCIIT